MIGEIFESYDNLWLTCTTSRDFYFLREQWKINFIQVWSLYGR